MSKTTPPSAPQITVPYDQFQISSIAYWIEANGYKPHLLIDTSFEGLRLPPQCMQKEQEVINIHSAACSKFSWLDDRMEFNTRFGGRDFRLVIPYHSIQAINFAGTGMWLPMPWTRLVTASGGEAVQVVAVAEVEPAAVEAAKDSVVQATAPPVEQVVEHAHIDESQAITETDRDRLLGKTPDERVSGIQGSTVTAVDFRGKARLPK